jgi:flagella basal body P-ring formation protein FlgA
MKLKRSVIIIAILFSFEFIFAVELSLKDRITVTSNFINLSDIISEPVAAEIGDIRLADISYFPYKLNNDEIAGILIERGYKDLIVKGKEVIIYRNSNDEKSANQLDEIKKTGKNAIKFLEEQLSTYVDKSKYRLKINMTGSTPFLDLESLGDDFIWELSKFNYGLKDIAGIKKMVLKSGDIKYDVDLDINIYANVYLARRSFKKGESFKNDFFFAKNVDITLYKDPEDIVLEPAKAFDSRFSEPVGSGEVLRWSSLSKNPLVVKDQNLKILIDKNGFRITVNCVALSDCFENDKLKVKLENGREKTGVLRKMDGECYVELL